MSEDAARIARAIGDLMRVAGSERVHAGRQRAVGLELSQTELRFLGVVAEHGPLPVTELGAILHLSQPTASRTLRRLEDEGLVHRSADDADARVARFAATDLGRGVRDRFEAHMAVQMESSLAGMSLTKRRHLADLLEELVTGTHTADA
jgi:DNA-binding MarR family transcriptional regulator